MEFPLLEINSFLMIVAYDPVILEGNMADSTLFGVEVLVICYIISKKECPS